MAINRSGLRTDITYLSRRRKSAANTIPIETAQTGSTQRGNLNAQGTPKAPLSLDLGHRSTSSASLSLDGGSADARTDTSAASPTQERPNDASFELTLSGHSLGKSSSSPAIIGFPTPSVRPLTPAVNPVAGRTQSVAGNLFSAPSFGSIRELSEENPVVRLNARQSAIGSLLVVGSRSVAWEDHILTSGAQRADGQAAGTPVFTPGNRPLVGIQDGAGIVSLRHVAQVRRVLFISGERSQTVGVFDGAAVGVAARNAEGYRSVLYLTRVAEILELRADFVPADAPDEAIWAIFGFAMTLPLDQRIRLR